jgi:hypothetical protein
MYNLKEKKKRKPTKRKLLYLPSSDSREGGKHSTPPRTQTLYRSGSNVFRDAAEVRLPRRRVAAGAHPPSVLLRRLPLLLRRRQRSSAEAELLVANGGENNAAFGLAPYVPAAPATACAPLLLGVLGDGRGWNEEVDLPALELGVRRHDEYPAAHHPRLLPRRGGGGCAGAAEHVVGVRGEHLGGRHGAAVLVDAAAEVHDPDQVQRAAGQHARQAATQAVAHDRWLLSRDDWW